MIVVQDVQGFSRQQRRCVATIGKFDGVHRGHRLILDQLKNKAAELGLPSLVILIEPHPEEFFASSAQQCPARLTTLDEKLQLLEACGIDFVFQLTFDQALSELSAEDYISRILVDGLAVACFIAGNDFRFGHQRQGDYQLLLSKGAELDFEVLESASFEVDGHRVSSTYVRENLSSSNFALVEKLLGRPYSIKGEVVKGLQLGADLGFPTCNIRLQRRQIPLHGVYACEVVVDKRRLHSAVNIGYRPTITEAGEALLEAHLLDFDGDLYGKSIDVIFRHKIRNEQKFANLDALKQQLATDVDQVAAFFQDRI